MRVYDLSLEVLSREKGSNEITLLIQIKVKNSNA